jgi:hypothetical protein
LLNPGYGDRPRYQLTVPPSCRLDQYQGAHAPVHSGQRRNERLRGCNILADYSALISARQRAPRSDAEVNGVWWTGAVLVEASFGLPART